MGVPCDGEALLPPSTTLSQDEIGFVTGHALGMDPGWVTKEDFQEVGRRMMGEGWEDGDGERHDRRQGNRKFRICRASTSFGICLLGSLSRCLLLGFSP